MRTQGRFRKGRTVCAGACVVTLLTLTPLLRADIVADVKSATATRDFTTADRKVEAFRKARGSNAELALAISWEARGALAAKDLDRAQTYADKTRTLALQLLKKRKLDADPMLPLALGASIEVEAQVMAARGESSSAVAFLKRELQTYRTTSIAERIGKNINLLSMEGKPAPALDAKEWIGTKPPALASLRGKPVLLFFWAHWCPDCKNEAPIITNLMRRYSPRGLTVIAPTKYYGYVAEGKDAGPAEEKRYIQEVRDRYYSSLTSVPVPLSDVNFTTFGCSSTPTLALVDKQGVVRWYHPGAATEAELVKQIEKLL